LIRSISVCGSAGAEAPVALVEPVTAAEARKHQTHRLRERK
jgi:hypothetical protein